MIGLAPAHFPGDVPSGRRASAHEQLQCPVRQRTLGRLHGMQAELTEGHQQAERLARRVLAVPHREKEPGATGISVGGAVDPMGGPTRLEKDLAQLPGERHGLAVWRGDNAEVGRWWKFNQAEDQLRVLGCVQPAMSRQFLSAIGEERAEQGQEGGADVVARVIPNGGQDECRAEDGRGHTRDHQKSRGLVPPHGAPHHSREAPARRLSDGEVRQHGDDELRVRAGDGVAGVRRSRG